MFMSLFCKNDDIYQYLLGRTQSFSQFESKLKKISDKRAAEFGYDDDDSGKNKMKGDLFEIFVEGFIHLCGSHSSVCISSYEPVAASEDYGVDGKGLCMRGTPLTVQAKFRSQIDYELVSDDLHQFWGQSLYIYDVELRAEGNMVVVTNCAGMHWRTHTNVMCQRMRTINRKEIFAITKSNNCFWDNLRGIMIATFKSHLGPDFEYDWNKKGELI